MKYLIFTCSFLFVINHPILGQSCTDNDLRISHMDVYEGENYDTPTWEIGPRTETGYFGCSTFGYIFSGIAENVSITGPANVTIHPFAGTVGWVPSGQPGIIRIRIKGEYVNKTPPDCTPAVDYYSCYYITKEIHVTYHPKVGPPIPPYPPIDDMKPLVEHYHQLTSSSERVLLKKDSLFRVSADGTETSIFKFYGGDVNFNNASFTIYGNPDNSESGSSIYGSYGLIHQSEDSLVVRFKHPNRVIEGANNTSAIFDIQTPNKTYSYGMNVSHPPLLLVNGLFTDRLAFSKIELNLINSGLYKNTRYIKTFDYGSNPLNVSFFDNAQFVKSSINDLINEMVNIEKTATGAVDIVAHVDGGISSRLYLQGNNYNNDVHKFITINTPHSGTQFANFWTEPIRQDFQCWNHSKWCDKGAISNLKVDSPFIRTYLNGSNRTRLTVPSHSISTQIISSSKYFTTPPSTEEWLSCGTSIGVWTLFGVPAFGALDCLESFVSGRLKAAAMAAAFNVSGAAILGGFHDFVSSVESQKGGLPENCSSLIYNQHADKSVESDNLVTKVVELLRANASGENFTTSGFNPPVLDIYPIFNNFSIGETTNSSSLNIKKPVSGSKYFKGTLLDINIVSENIDNIYLMLSHSEDMVYALQSQEDSINIKFSTDSLLGQRTLYVIGKTPSGHFVRDSVSFYVTDDLCDHVHTNSYLFVTDRPSSGIYTFNNIVSDAIIEEGRNVSFQTVGNGSINFIPGFEAVNQSVFKTNRIDCYSVESLARKKNIREPIEKYE